MHKRSLFTLFALLLCHFTWAKAGTSPNSKPKTKTTEKEQFVLLETDSGKIKIKLYNETPKHRDNFIKLANEHFFDSLLFHRVIQSFMIQGGDPDSKKAPAGTMLGNGGPGYTIPAEIVPALYHKKGALAAARLGDDVNPSKESSGSQFYIVQGKTFSNNDLDVMEQRMNMQARNLVFNQVLIRPENEAIKNKLIQLQTAGKMDSLQIIARQLDPQIEAEMKNKAPFKYTDEQRKAYTSVGGTPHLDGSYTVFGEVVEGLNVIDKIAGVQVDGNARPIKDIRMKISVVNK